MTSCGSIGSAKKDPDAVLDYGFNWGLDSDYPDKKPWLDLDNGEAISTSVWVIPDGLTEDSAEFGATATKVWLSGGTAGSSYTITNTITTSEGRTDERSMLIIVAER